MMKIFYCLPAVALILSSTGCKNKANTQGEEIVAESGLNLANLDTTAVAGNDFFRYATGGWSDANPIPDEYSRYGSFDQLRENNQKQIKGIIEELGKEENKAGSNAQKIGDLYFESTNSLEYSKSRDESWDEYRGIRY